MQILRPLILLAGILLPLSAQKAEPVQGRPVPTQFLQAPWIIGAETGERWRGLLPQVNAPDIRTRAFPGQRLTVAIGAQGQDRDQLLKAATYEVTLQLGGETRIFKDLHPSQTWQIRTDSADSPRVSLALLDLEWVVPATTKGGEAKVMVSAKAPSGATPSFKEASLEVWSFDRTAKDGGFKDAEACEEWMMSYYQQPSPSRLLAALRMARDDPHAYQAPLITFYIGVLKSDPAAAADTLMRLGAEEIPTRYFGYYLYRQAGYDISGPLGTLTPAQREGFEKGAEGLPALPNPYDLAPDPADPMKISNHMDMLWNRFLVTGSQEPVRAIASVLQWREDGKAFLELRKSGKKPDGISLELARGLSYMASGWSLASFVRTHPLVADYIALWRVDMLTPRIVQEELETLLTNEAFQKED